MGVAVLGIDGCDAAILVKIDGVSSRTSCCNGLSISFYICLEVHRVLGGQWGVVKPCTNLPHVSSDVQTIIDVHVISLSSRFSLCRPFDVLSAKSENI